MNQSEIKKVILSHLKDYSILKVGIFGSFARGDNKKGSDLDILVEFKESPSLLTLLNWKMTCQRFSGLKLIL